MVGMRGFTANPGGFMNTLNFERHGLGKPLLDAPRPDAPLLNQLIPTSIVMLLVLLLPLLLLLSGTARAQSAMGCPRLPASTGLKWESSTGPDFVFCRALRADGSQAFGVYLGEDSPFEPKRRNRTETDTIDGQSVYWYRSEVATRPDIEVRETLLELDDGREAHIFFEAAPGEPLANTFRMVQQLRFGATALSSN